jgi:hypothetical protein
MFIKKKKVGGQINFGSGEYLFSLPEPMVGLVTKAAGEFPQ